MSRLVTAALVLSVLAAGAPALRAGDESELYKKVSAGCFETLVDGRLGGSGWFSTEPGWGFTAAHVVKNGSAKLQVQTEDHTWNARLRAVDMQHDIALLKIDHEHRETPSGLPMARAFPPVGAEIRLQGAPIFRHRVWLPGRVASHAPVYEFLGGDKMVIRCFHVAGVAPKGTSGGPWVNTDGEVVGLQSGGMTSKNALVGISFVTPVDALGSILKSKQPARTPTLGAAAEEIVEQPVEWIAALPENQSGIVLKVITKNGPLDQANAKNSDMLLSINGTSFTTRDGFYRTLHQLDPTKPATVVLRNGEGETKTHEVTPSIQEARFEAATP